MKHHLNVRCGALDSMTAMCDLYQHQTLT